MSMLKRANETKARRAYALFSMRANGSRQDKGVNIYTHGEMLPCHAYPKLKKYPHLKGNFGTAWQNQQKEFGGIGGGAPSPLNESGVEPVESSVFQDKNVPAAFLFTTNCIMPPKDNYKGRVFTTSIVGYAKITGKVA